MASPKSNVMLPLMALAALAAGALVYFDGHDTSNEPGYSSADIRGPGADADSPAESMRTIGAQMTAMRKQLREQRQDNARLLKQKDEIQRNLERQMADKLAAMPAPSPAPAVDSLGGDVADQLMVEIDGLREQVEAMQTASTTPYNPPTDPLVEPPINPVMPVTWIRPIGMESAGPASTPPTGGKLLGGDFPLPGTSTTGRSAASTTATGGANTATATTVQAPAVASTVPVYTIADNATLIGSTAMTALIGRIPIKGRVPDPYPFKVIIGKDNLAANGLQIPGVTGMIFSGTAVGDWNLECVSGEVTSATFVFEDGTIRTIEESSTVRTGTGNAPAARKAALGWISDNSGVPCVSGKKVTNAPSYLAGRTLVATIAAAAEAAAASQTTNVVSPIGGTTTSVVTGENAKFILGRGFGDGMAEVTKWLDERQSQSFDAIFVPPGATVAVHIEKEMRIDYERHGRKLAYGNPVFGKRRRSSGLD